MTEELSEVLKKEAKKPIGKGRKFLKIIGLGCAGLIGILILFVAVGLTLTKLDPIYTDAYGTVWQKYKGDTSTPAFTVFAEQDGTSESGTTNVKLDISSECDPAGSGTQYLHGDFTKGVERPNHCVIENHMPTIRVWETDPVLDYYLLLSDGSIISLNGSVANKIQVNVNDDGINIIQSEGIAYYHIQKQSEGKKFTIQLGPETFTAVGTDLAFQASKGATFYDRNYLAAVIDGSVHVTRRVIPNLISRVIHPDGTINNQSNQRERDQELIDKGYRITYSSRITAKIAPTFTPIAMGSTDSVLTNQFVQKQMIIIVAIFVNDATFDKIKSGMQQAMANTLSTNQAVVDKADVSREEMRNNPTPVTSQNSNLYGGGWDGSSDSSSSSSGTDRCAQIPSAINLSLLDYCDPTHRGLSGDKSDWIFCGYSDGNAGYLPPECVPPGIPTKWW